MATTTEAGSSGAPFGAAQLRAAYGVADLIASNGCNGPCNGSGETVAVLGSGRFAAADVARFAPDLAPPLLTATILEDGPPRVDDGSAPTTGEDAVESALDIETIHAIAPAARIHLYEFSTASTEEPAGFSDDLVRFVHEILRNRESVASISLGLCERSFTDAQLTEVDRAFHAASDAGVTVFSASGDSGSKCSDDGLTFSQSDEVFYPPSDPYVTSVGGTVLTLDERGAYGGEAAWDEGEKNASGGMFSRFFPKPSSQAGAGVPPLCCSDAGASGRCGPCRVVPDVAADASSKTALRYCFEGTCDEARGGTSAAAPMWAGFAAIFDEYADAHGLARLGLAAPRLYALTRAGWPSGLHDVTTVERDRLGRGGVHLWGLPRPFWDRATGLGSFDACKLVGELVAPASGPSCSAKAGRVVPPSPPVTTTAAQPSPSGSHEITGRVEDNKFDCVLDSANDVSVADENGTIIGVAEMGPLQGPKSDCYEEFVIHAVPDAAFYKFEESGIVVATYSRAQLEALDWKVPPLYQT